MKVCGVEGCGRKHCARGYCSKHYKHIKRHGRIIRGRIYDKKIIKYDNYCEIIIEDKNMNVVAKTLVDVDFSVDNIGSLWIDSLGYVSCTINRKNQRLHRMIMGFPDGVVDHINRDKLDNRKSNLRITTNKMNCFNQKISKNNSCGCVGVYWDKRRQKWVSSICVDSKNKYLGRFDNFDDAVAARKEAELKYFGEIIDR